MAESEPESRRGAAGRPDLAVRTAAVLHVALGLGFGAGGAWTMLHFGRTGELPMTIFGFRSMSGPFEALPPSQFSVLGWSLVAVCAVDVVAGAWLWQGRRRGAVLGLATALPALGLATGFALPFLMAGVPVRTALDVVGIRRLRA